MFSEAFVINPVSPIFISFVIGEALFLASTFVSKKQNVLLLHDRNTPCFRAAVKQVASFCQVLSPIYDNFKENFHTLVFKPSCPKSKETF